MITPRINGVVPHAPPVESAFDGDKIVLLPVDYIGPFGTRRVVDEALAERRYRQAMRTSLSEWIVTAIFVLGTLSFGAMVVLAALK